MSLLATFKYTLLLQLSLSYTELQGLHFGLHLQNRAVAGFLVYSCVRGWPPLRNWWKRATKPFLAKTTPPLRKYISIIISPPKGNYGAHHIAFFLSSYKYTKAIDKTQAQPDHIIYVNRSCAYSAQSRYKEALVDANMAIKIKPSDYLGWVGKGRALFGLGFLGALRQRDRIGELVLTFVCRDGQRSIRTSPQT